MLQKSLRPIPLLPVFRLSRHFNSSILFNHTRSSSFCFLYILNPDLSVALQIWIFIYIFPFANQFPIRICPIPYVSVIRSSTHTHTYHTWSFQPHKSFISYIRFAIRRIPLDWFLIARHYTGDSCVYVCFRLYVVAVCMCYLCSLRVVCCWIWFCREVVFVLNTTDSPFGYNLIVFSHFDHNISKAKMASTTENRFKQNTSTLFGGCLGYQESGMFGGVFGISRTFVVIVKRARAHDTRLHFAFQKSL